MPNIIILWLFFRILTSIFAGIISSLRPLTPIEISIPFFPPSTPIIQWLNRVFISPWMRWDAVWFERIVAQGYSGTDGTTTFHPLYPWLATPLTRIGISPALSLMMVGIAASIGVFYCFTKIAQLDLQPKDAFFALIIFSLAPPAFILFAPYSEALFILLSVLCFYMMRKHTWWLAGIMGGLATLTRQQGLLLVLPMAWEIWENAGRDFKQLRKHWRNIVSLCFIPFGMLAWILYRALVVNDFTVNFTNIQSLIYSFVISPSAIEVVPDQKFVWPWLAIYYSLQKIISQPDVDIWVNLIAAFHFLVILGVSWKNLRPSYRIYSLAITIISFSYTTGSIHPYMGLPRHLFLAFPIFIGFTILINKNWIRLLIVGVSAIGTIFLLGLYVLNAWVP